MFKPVAKVNTPDICCYGVIGMIVFRLCDIVTMTVYMLKDAGIKF